MDPEREVALYYPYIDINDVGLIKTAALYWDEIQTIVPQDEVNKGHQIYNTLISIEAYKENLLKPRIVSVADEVLWQVADEILEDIKRKPQILDGIAKLIRNPQRPRKRIEAKFSTIHIEKFNPVAFMKLKELLSKAGIIISPKDNNADWIIVPKPFYDMYMSRLTSIIAAKDKTVPLTNKSLWQDVMIDRYRDYSDELKYNQSQIAMMSLKTLSIEPATPLIEVLRFRNKNRKLLLIFRRNIRELARQISSGLQSSDKQIIFEELLRDKIMPIKEEVEAKLNESEIIFGFSCFDIVQAATIAFIASGGQNWLSGIAGAAFSLTISTIKGLREDRNIITGHPFGYLYKAQQELGKKTK